MLNFLKDILIFWYSAVRTSYLLHTAYSQYCANLPRETGTGTGDTWIGGWEYFKDSEERLTIQTTSTRRVRVDGGSYVDATCELVDVYKNATATSAYYWGNMILSQSTGG